jgi:UDP:flavonoid glycosyltransferase YjiC (YdhE family)
MRVYVAPCGMGLGHITRTAPIADELNRRGSTTVFSTYTDGLDYAKRKHLPTYEAVPIGFQVTSDGTIDFKMTAATNGFSLGIRTLLRQVILEMKYMKTFKPDVVFSDSRASSLLAARLLHIPVVLMLNQFRIEIIKRPSTRRVSLLDKIFFTIANIGWLFIRTSVEIVWGLSQVILIPDLPSPYTICLGNLGIPRRFNHKVKLIGPIVENHYEPVKDLTGLRRRLCIESNKPLIYAAISGPKVERSILTKILLNSMQPLSSKYNVVLSCGNPNGNRDPRTSNGLTVYDWIENQNDFIRAADLVISRAGHGTIMKSIVYGKPMILIPIPDHTEQYANARRATILHVAEMMDQHKLSEESLEAAIRKILDNEHYHMNATEIREKGRLSNAVNLACDTLQTVSGNR